MQGQMVAPKRNVDEIGAVRKISILVVDDDTTCLLIVAAKLKKFHYEVDTAKHPNDALCILRIKAGAFDLVVADVHMPEMNGIQLQQVISREFNLPVVLMSADEKDDIILRGLKSGAEFFMRKPISSNDIMDLWQHSCKKKLYNKVVVEEKDESFPKGRAPLSTHNYREVVLASSENEIKMNKISKRISTRKYGPCGNGEESSQNASHKKKKVAWTNSLHNRFLEAIQTIGLDRATPKKILDTMNVPGLTREHIASHWQKYRIFLNKFNGGVTNQTKQSSHHYNSFSMKLAPGFTSSSSSTKPSSSVIWYDNFTSLQNHDPQHFLEPINVFTNQETISPSLVTPGTDFETSFGINGMNPILDSMMSMSSNLTDQANYAGPDISNVHCINEINQSSKGAISFFGDIGSLSNNVNGVSDPNQNPINPYQLTWQLKDSSSNLVFDTSFGGEKACGVMGESQMLLSSNALENGNLENEWELQTFAKHASFNFEELLQLPKDDTFECQNQTQIEGESTPIIDFRGNTSGWINHIPSFDHGPDELLDEDEFLKSLFDPLFEPDYTFEEHK